MVHEFVICEIITTNCNEFEIRGDSHMYSMKLSEEIFPQITSRTQWDHLFGAGLPCRNLFPLIERPALGDIYILNDWFISSDTVLVSSKDVLDWLSKNKAFSDQPVLTSDMAPA